MCNSASQHTRHLNLTRSQTRSLSNSLTLKLTHSQTLKLTHSKGDMGVLPPNTKSVAIGLGWSVPGSLDLDASAMIVGGYDDNTGFRRELGCVMYSNTTFNGSDGKVFIKHSGDNTTGAGAGDDEVINVLLDHAPFDCQVGGGRWAVGGGRWAVGGGRWAVGGGRWVHEVSGGSIPHWRP